LKKVCLEKIGPKGSVSKDGVLSWVEVECLGACANAPMVQINDDYYEDLTSDTMTALLGDLSAGKPVKTGPQNQRFTSEPEGGSLTLNAKGLYSKVKAKKLPNVAAKSKSKPKRKAKAPKAKTPKVKT